MVATTMEVTAAALETTTATSPMTTQTLTTTEAPEISMTLRRGRTGEATTAGTITRRTILSGTRTTTASGTSPDVSTTGVFLCKDFD